jgi:DNA-binding XRE family transcriptional regulator
MTNPSNSKPRPDNPDFSDLLALFGANLRTARLKLGLTQARLAEQSGLLRQYVSLVDSASKM